MLEVMSDVIPTVWPCVNYRDARPAITFLTDVLGFRETIVVPDEHDAAAVAHAELRWPEGGGVMLGSADRPGNEFSQLPTGCASLYVVTDDPQPVYDRVVAAGATIVREMRDEDYGSRGFSTRDRGQHLVVGTYRGEA